MTTESAFSELTLSIGPQEITSFAKRHGISLAVLHQSKRFDKTGLPGIVHIKDGLIWREVNKPQTKIETMTSHVIKVTCKIARVLIGIVVGLVIIFNIFEWWNSYEHQENRMLKAFDSPIGYSVDFALTKRNTFNGKYDKIAIVYGYGDDYKGCAELASILNEKYDTPSLYRCQQINKE